MKYISPLFCTSLVILTSCMTTHEYNPADSIIRITDTRGNIVGKGVSVNNEKIMTATHVYRDCQKIGCQYMLGSRLMTLLGDISPDIDGDRALLSIAPLIPETRSLLEYSTPLSGMSIYALVSRSGSWLRIEGKILGVDREYIGYDTTLSGMIFTGAIETDIILEKGESGTPIWSSSGGFIGIMSAVEKNRGRGWLVR